jgi:hypothetical protein
MVEQNYITAVPQAQVYKDASDLEFKHQTVQSTSSSKQQSNTLKVQHFHLNHLS